MVEAESYLSLNDPETPAAPKGRPFSSSLRLARMCSTPSTASLCSSSSGMRGTTPEASGKDIFQRAARALNRSIHREASAWFALKVRKSSVERQHVWKWIENIAQTESLTEIQGCRRIR